ncbi:hypothetical protein C8F04DRAFT_337824 [Mycena alexandri]|uniref:F-box domain-containing protein n=1 Tax=Mycena alexandri TaxID=1745969 RepID=A0AAD6S5G9_9AGAR|nr:hypothetical protein C8F04DRAFT_337824 [Mycena alexandri]
MHYHLQADRDRAAELDAQILDLERALSSLRVERAMVQKELDSFKYPVLTLPNETMAEIFLHFLPIYPKCSPLKGPFSPINLTHICRKWRDIVLSTPTLWSSISLYFGHNNPTAEVHKLEIWLSRSGCCPMSVQITIDDHLDYKFSSAHCARWEALNIILPSSCLPITETSMPLLRQLDLYLAVDDHFTPSNLTLCGKMPLLRSVVMNDGAANSVTLPWVQLTSLELHNVYPSECTPILQQTLNLIHCRLLIFEGDDDDSTLDDTTLPHLESLVLADFGGGGAVKGYAETFIVPALRELDILERFLTDPVNSLKSFMSKSGCHLQKVTIDGPRYVSNDVYRTAFPSIEFSFAGEYVGKGPDIAP